jgi:hypothetical protein
MSIRDDQAAQDVMKQSKLGGTAEEGMRVQLLQTSSEHAAHYTSTHAPLVKSAMESGAQADGSYATGIVQLGAIEEHLSPHAGLMIRERLYLSQILCGACEKQTQRLRLAVVELHLAVRPARPRLGRWAAVFNGSGVVEVCASPIFQLPLAAWETREQMSRRESACFLSCFRLHFGRVHVDTREGAGVRGEGSVLLQIHQARWFGGPSRILWSQRYDLADLVPRTAGV